MNASPILSSAEAVCLGHPDKLCDQISDAVLDAFLDRDPFSHVACEAMIGSRCVTISGEASSLAEGVDLASIAARTIASVGYDPGDYEYRTDLVAQGQNLKRTVDRGGANDQAIVVGYACAGTPNLMPDAVNTARYYARTMDRAPDAGPDGKVLVSDIGGSRTVFASVQGAYDLGERVLVSRFSAGGPAVDTGLTGRKIAVDAYGSAAPVGGGAFSGKDPTKIDRSGAYMARFMAVDSLRQQGAREALVVIVYGFGLAEPISSRVTLDGVYHEPGQWYDLRPEAIIERFDLRRVRYLPYAQAGHFGTGGPWDV